MTYKRSKRTKKIVAVVTAAIFVITSCVLGVQMTGFPAEKAYAAAGVSVEKATTSGTAGAKATGANATATASNSAAEIPETAEYVEGEAVVCYEDDTIDVVSDDDATTEEIIEEYENNPDVESVEPNYIFRTCESVEPSEIEKETLTRTEAEKTDAFAGDYTSEQWGFNSESFGLNVPAWNTDENENASGTVVAVLDTGVWRTHEDLDDVMWDDGLKYETLKDMGGGRYGINTSGDTSTTDIMDCSKEGHGTHCAGTIAAEWNNIGISGGCNGTEIMAIRAAKPHGNGGEFTLQSILNGYKYIIAAKNAGVNVVAINNSWAADDPVSGMDSIVKMIKKAGDAGIVSVFASGNSGADCDVNYSGSKYLCAFYEGIPEKIVVNNIDGSGAKSNSSNYGKKSTDLAAPGTNILSTVTEGEYGYNSGTSMAAPFVTAEVAILCALHPDFTAAEIVQLINENTTEISSMKKKCTTGGEANVSKAVSADAVTVRDLTFTVAGKSLTYTGKAKTPAVSCAEGYEDGKDFNVTYSNNKNVGQAKATITGMGNVLGTTTISFEIKPQKTVLKTVKSGKKQFTATWTKKTKQVTGYVLQYSTDKDFSGDTESTAAAAKTVKIKSAATAARTIKNLKSGSRYYVRIKTYKVSSGKTYSSEWSTVKAVRVK